jgi:hypothetical protein
MKNATTNTPYDYASEPDWVYTKPNNPYGDNGAIYMKTLIEWWRRLLYGKPAFDGYTFDVDQYRPITEADYESVTALSSPAVTAHRRRFKGSTTK